MFDSTVELAATCNALGYFDPATNKYYADENTLETAKDLIRFLRRDDDNHEVRRSLGQTKVVQTDLLPLLKSYWEQTELFDILLRLLVNLTTPALALWREELPADQSTRNYYLQIEDHLQSYKQAFADDAIWAVLSTRLSKILEIEYYERGDANSLIIERILILIRNVLYVPSNPDVERRPDNDANTHDQVLWALHQSGMLDIILYISSSSNEKAYYMHTLEILSFMFREQNASDLAQAALQRSQTEKIRDEAELVALRHREMNQKQDKVKMYNGTRHSRFGGTFVVKSMKSITDNELIYHKPLNKLEELNFDVDKQKTRKPKNRLPVHNKTSERRSTFTIRLFLKEFCIDFLNGAYNTLMYHVKDSLARAKVQAHDESYYLWAVRFFMEFNRHYKFEVKLVSETMSTETFHFVQRQMENHFDTISTDKKKRHLWSRRLHLALLAYRELLLTICAMDKSPDGTVRDSAKVIKSNIFYVIEYREFILTLLVTFDELKMSSAYLNDLIETQHIFLKMFEVYCGKDNSVVFQGKARINKKSKRGKSGAQQTTVRPPPKISVESQWDEIAPQLSVVLEGSAHIPSDVVPFDATAPISIDEQKPLAMVKVQKLLREQNFETAVAFLRAAREVWPENDSFGNSNMAPEEEFLAIREIFFAELQDDDESATPATTTDVPVADDEDEEDEEEDGNAEMDINETNFKFEDFLKRFAHPKIIRACGLTLKNFDTNTLHTNHCIVKLLHRIAFKCCMSTMIFQVSIFRTFQRIFAMKHLPQFKELVKFATFIVQKFISVASKNPKVYMECLFWSSSKDAYDIEMGYGSYQEKSSAVKNIWTELEEEELRRLFMEHQENRIEEDVVDWLVKNLIDHTRTRRVVLKKLKDMYLLTAYKPRKYGTSGKNQKQWNEDEEAQLRELFEEFHQAMDPLTCIMERLDVPRPKNRIIEKLLIMGLVQDRKELRKKRAKKSQGSAKVFRHSDSNSDSDSETTNSTNRQTGAPQSTNKNVKKSKGKRTQKTTSALKASSVEISKLLLANIENGMSEALEWIQESLTEAADDLENNIDLDDSDEGVPLVPIMESALVAMDVPIFQNLLKAIGINEPADEQQSYWRISGELKLQQLRNICETITAALEGRLPPPALEIPIQPSTSNYVHEGESSSDEDVFDRVRKFMAKPESKEGRNSALSSRRNSTSSNSSNSDRSESNASISQMTNKSAKQKKKPSVNNDSDDSDVEKPSTSASIQSSQASKVSKNSAINSRRSSVTSSSNESSSSSQTSHNNYDNDDSATKLITNSGQQSSQRSTTSAVASGSNSLNIDSNSKSEKLNSEKKSVDTKRRRKIAVLDDSDSEDDINQAEIGNENETENNDEGADENKRSRYLDSDSDPEMENDGPKVKRAKVIQSDEDSD